MCVYVRVDICMRVGNQEARRQQARETMWMRLVHPREDEHILGPTFDENARRGRRAEAPHTMISISPSEKPEADAVEEPAAGFELMRPLLAAAFAFAFAFALALALAFVGLKCFPLLASPRRLGDLRRCFLGASRSHGRISAFD